MKSVWVGLASMGCFGPGFSDGMGYLGGLYMCFGIAQEEERRMKREMKMRMMPAYTVCSPGMNARITKHPQ